MKRQQLNNIYLSGQKHTIFEHLKIRGSISQVEAQEVYRIRRLAARISEMKSDGYPIMTVMKKDLSNQKYAKYYLTPITTRNKHLIVNSYLLLSC
jgi:hypothetical protein